MISQQIHNFLQSDLKIKDEEVSEYLNFLIENNRIIEIEPFLKKNEFMSLMELYEKENRRNLVFDCGVKMEDFNDSSEECTDHDSNENLNQEYSIKNYFFEKSFQINDEKYKMIDILPVSNYKKEIIQKLKKNQILLIEGSTGCGKSTQIPKYLLNYFEKIIVSQPRRIAAVNLCKRVRNEVIRQNSNLNRHDEIKNKIKEDLEMNHQKDHPKVECHKKALNNQSKINSIKNQTENLTDTQNINGLIAYKIRFKDESTKSTKLKFVTDGILLQSRHEHFDLIIIDEVHERKINIDIFFSILNRFKFKKMILMSATGNFYKLKEYFKGMKCDSIRIESKGFEKKIVYLEEECFDYKKRIVEIMRNEQQKIVQREFEYYSDENVKKRKLCSQFESADGFEESYTSSNTDKIHHSDVIKNILVFLPGINEINQLNALLIQNNLNTHFEILKLHSSISSFDQQLIFKKYRKSKLILSTNIAETSITIDDLDIIIDSGLFKRKIFKNGIEELKIESISKEQAIQRAGRVGRVKNGIIYRIYTKPQYNSFSDENTPEIKNTNLSNLIIYLKKLEIKNIMKLNFLDQPDMNIFKKCLEKLIILNLIKNGKLTKLGHLISYFPVEPELSLCLIKAYELDVLEHMSSLCALLSAQNLFHYKIEEFEELKKMFSDGNDFFFLLNVYGEFIRGNYKRNAKMRNVMNLKGFREVQRVKEQILSMFVGALEKEEFKDLKIKKRSNAQVLQSPEETKNSSSSISNQDIKLRIKESICSGFFLNVAIRKNISFFKLQDNEEIYIHPLSSLNRSNSQIIVYHTLFQSKKLYVKCCMDVSESMLVGCSERFKKV